MQGEVPTDALEAYRRAGNMAYDFLHRTEAQRLDLKIQGLNPWTAPTSTQAHLLCVWNAFVLQTLGNEFLDADYRADPQTIGFVPPNTAAQIMAFYHQVESWLSRAHQAQSNPTYRLDIGVPAELPNWNPIKPCPRTHLVGMMAATRLVRTQAEGAITTFEIEGLTEKQQDLVQKLRQRLAETSSKAEYTEQLWNPQIPEPLHERLEGYAKEVIEQYYLLGQMLAMPQLLEQHLEQRIEQKAPVQNIPAPQPINRPLRSSGVEIKANQQQLPLPGKQGFDPWCLTDPIVRKKLLYEPEAIASLQALWYFDPNPAQTLAIQAIINEALQRGLVDYATDVSGNRIGHYHCCPWAPIYVSKASIVIGDYEINALQEFTYDVGGNPFKRQILVGYFQPTEKLNY